MRPSPLTGFAKKMEKPVIPRKLLEDVHGAGGGGGGADGRRMRRDGKLRAADGKLEGLGHRHGVARRGAMKWAQDKPVR